jgi:hypothetical protein
MSLDVPEVWRGKVWARDLQVISYRIDDVTTIEYRGPGWVVCSFSQVLNKDGYWECEPQPSSRTEEFRERTRFVSPQVALDAFNMELEQEAREE